jgi:hypothetical protein
MRLAFWILLLVNLLLFVWGQGFFAAKQEGHEPERLQRQIEVDKLRILKDDAQPVTPAAMSAAAPGAALACRRLEGLSAEEAAALLSTVAALPTWAAGQPLLRSEAPTHWVVIPELSSRALAEKKKGELEKLGIKDSEIVEAATQGPFAVSLGVFRNQQLADEFLQSLTKKGVRSARLIQRTPPAAKFAVELRAPAEEIDQKVPDLLPPQAQVKLVDCGAS